MKKKIAFVFMFVMMIFIVASAENNIGMEVVKIEKEEIYPEKIEWNGLDFYNTYEFYSEDEVQLIKIGEWRNFEIFEEKEQGYNSKFIKTPMGYLHYRRIKEIVKKPNIYLYPTQKKSIKVSIDFNGEITSSYPKYNDGWNVVAKKNGEILNLADNKKYSYLFWEGESNEKWNIEEGFVVKGTDTSSFLQDKLEYMGLIPQEYNEFIVYWLPLMEKNKYNYISFVNEEYSEKVKLNVTPKPDKVIRVFMVFRGIEDAMTVKEQKLIKSKRKGFTVVEWGGMEIE